LKKAVILDRDGVINEMVYRKEQDFVDSPTSLKQFSIIKGVPKALKIIKNLGFSIIIVSNQPGIAKGYYSKKTFELIRKKMHNELGKRGKMIDGEYYCLHHPHAKLLQYRKNYYLITDYLINNILLNYTEDHLIFCFSKIWN